MQLNQILTNYKNLIAKIDEYNQTYKNNSKLLLVSKNLTQEQILHILSNSSQRSFGENKIQDAMLKWHDIKDKYPDVKLHFIGKLQKNKIKKAVELFDVIETIDSIESTCKINEEMSKINKTIDFFIQINIGDEQQKSGVNLKNFDFILQGIKKEGIAIKGIICIPPKSGPSFFYFGYMAKLAKEHKIKEISMEMTSDFETAIKFGSTQVKIGNFITDNPSCS
jgi:pyridoxal phosphate enzyme (YggS family)